MKTNWAETYFKEKVNWKEYNYLLDKITQYQDREIDITVNLLIHVQNAYVFIYSITEDKFSQHLLSHYDKNDIITSYEKEGFFYSIIINYLDIENDFMNELDEIYKSISNKFTLISHSTSKKLEISSIILKSKS